MSNRYFMILTKHCTTSSQGIVLLYDREEQLKPLGLGKRNKTFSTVVDGVECLAGNVIGCAKTVDDVIEDF
jgi:hypothetical protein